MKYYNGESSNPYEGNDHNKAMLWFYERCWILQRDSTDEASILNDYIHAGLESFQQFDDVPLSLKALLFNRYAKTNQTSMEAVEAFKRFYLKYYAGETLNYRHYKGQERNPYPYTDARHTAWKIEALFTDLWPDSPMLSDCLEDYTRRGLSEFCQFDDTPIHLKAFLMNRYFQYAEREDVEAFKKFYTGLYSNRKSR